MGPRKSLSEQEIFAQPELVIKIMDRVVDIETPGVAYSRIAYFSTVDREWDEKKATIASVLRSGMIGQIMGDGERAHANPGSDYVKNLRAGRSDMAVHANIVGRSSGTSNRPTTSKTSVGRSWYVSGERGVAVLFDSTKFTELNPSTIRPYSDPVERDRLTFHSNDFNVQDIFEWKRKVNPSLKIGDSVLVNERNFDAQGMPTPDDELGFVFFPRIPRRMFTGLVVTYDTDTDKALAGDVIQLMIKNSRGNPSFFLPVYDMDGNLIWPKHMSHSEIQAMVKKKKE